MNRRKFGRNVAHYRALMRNLSISLILNKEIKTTLQKAKELRRVVEPLITKAKDPSLANIRCMLSKLFNNQKAVNELIRIGKSNIDRSGGYTSIKRIGVRTQDGATVVRIRILDYVHNEVKINHAGNGDSVEALNNDGEQDANNDANV